MTAPAGLLERIGGALFPSQQPMDGLITEEDIRNAQRQGLLGLGTGLLAASGPHTGPRTTLMQALGQGIQQGQQAQQGYLDTAQTRNVRGLQVQGMQREQQQAQQRAAARAQIVSQFPMPAANDPNALRQWIDQTLPLWLQHDPETAKQLSEIRKSLQPAAGRSVQHVDLGDRVQVIDGATGEVLREVPKAASPSVRMRGELMTPAAVDRATNAIVGSFDRQTKNYTTAHEAWSQVDNVLQRARSGTHSPDDIIQLIDGISRLNNPGAVVRVGTVALQLQKIGSYGDKLRMWYDRGARGAWPTDIIEGIARAAREIAQEHAKQYRDLRQRAVRRGERIGLDYMDEVLPNAWEGFDAGTPATPTAPLSSFNFGGRP